MDSAATSPLIVERAVQKVYCDVAVSTVADSPKVSVEVLGSLSGQPDLKAVLLGDVTRNLSKGFHHRPRERIAAGLACEPLLRELAQLQIAHGDILQAGY